MIPPLATTTPTARQQGLDPRPRPIRQLTPTPADARIAVVLAAYPTKHRRLGNAVGLDAPASVIEVLHALRDAGYRVDRIPRDGDALMAGLADRFTCESPQPHPRAVRPGSGSRPRHRVRALVRGAGPTASSRNHVHRGRASRRGVRRAVHPGRDRLSRAGPGRGARDRAAATGVRVRPDRYLPRARRAAAPPLPRLLPPARHGLSTLRTSPSRKTSRVRHRASRSR